MLWQRAVEAVPAAARAYDNLEFNKALEAVLSISERANGYLEERAPWSLLKKVAVVRSGRRVVSSLGIPSRRSLCLSTRTGRAFAWDCVQNFGTMQSRKHLWHTREGTVCFGAGGQL